MKQRQRRRQRRRRRVTEGKLDVRCSRDGKAIGNNGEEADGNGGGYQLWDWQRLAATGTADNNGIIMGMGEEGEGPGGHRPSLCPRRNLGVSSARLPDHQTTTAIAGDWFLKNGPAIPRPERC